MSATEKFKGPSPRSCGCKGIRSCFVCQQPIPTEKILAHQDSHTEHSLQKQTSQDEVHQKMYNYCKECGKAWLIEPLHLKTNNDKDMTVMEACNKNPTNTRESDMSSHCNHSTESTFDFPGIYIFENFVDKKEEDYLTQEVSKTKFVNSQSGRRKQDFGPKVNFKRQKLKTANFNGLPPYSEFLYDRMKGVPFLKDFRPVEMCNLEYVDERGAHIDPHFDDAWLWGERLVTLNLLSNSFLTFTIDSQPDVCVRVPLQGQSLIVVFGPARHIWKHSINMKDIHGRRIAMTFRELSSEFQEKGARYEEGQKLLDLALTFKGQAIAS